jgi:very-short-patch-repair endonuclease
MTEALLRRLGRDQWVRVHGTPRITVLAGGEEARQLWERWVSVANVPGELLVGEPERCMRDALAVAAREPARPVAVHGSIEALDSWRRGRSDRLAALYDEGVIRFEERASSKGVDAPRAQLFREAAAAIHTTTTTTDAAAGRVDDAPRAQVFDARSAAEAALYVALEATPATRGKFEVNGRLAVRFGSTAAEVDLLAREDGIAIEIDGYHHFTDAENYRRDRRKDLLLQTQGLIVIRVLAEDVIKDARDGVDVVCQALAYRMGAKP